MAESNGLLNRRTVNKLYRGFESRPLRSSQNTNDSKSQKTSNPLEQQGDTTTGGEGSSSASNPSSVTGEDSSDTDDGPCIDKPDDKLSDKTSPQDSTLQTVIEVWPDLPEVVKAGIVAMVKTSLGKGGYR